MPRLGVRQENLGFQATRQVIGDVHGKLRADCDCDTESAAFARHLLQPLAVLDAPRLVENEQPLEHTGRLAAQGVAMRLDNDEFGDRGLDLVIRQVVQVQYDLLFQQVAESERGVVIVREQAEIE